MALHKVTLLHRLTTCDYAEVEIEADSKEAAVNRLDELLTSGDFEAGAFRDDAGKLIEWQDGEIVSGEYDIAELRDEVDHGS